MARTLGLAEEEDWLRRIAGLEVEVECHVVLIEWDSIRIPFELTALP